GLCVSRCRMSEPDDDQLRYRGAGEAADATEAAARPALPAPGKVSLTARLATVQRRAAEPATATSKLDGVAFLSSPVQQRREDELGRQDDPFAAHLIGREPEATHAAA